MHKRNHRTRIVCCNAKVVHRSISHASEPEYSAKRQRTLHTTVTRSERRQ